MTTPSKQHDKDSLLEADPVGLTQRQMLLRLDARMDTFEGRIRVVEDEALVSKTERKTIKNLLVAALAVWPVVSFILLNVIHFQ